MKLFMEVCIWIDLIHERCIDHSYVVNTLVIILFTLYLNAVEDMEVEVKRIATRSEETLTTNPKLFTSN